MKGKQMIAYGGVGGGGGGGVAHLEWRGGMTYSNSFRGEFIRRRWMTHFKG